MNSVEDLLIKNNIRYTHANKDFLIKCLNPEHDDLNPSFRIDKVSGVSHCLSCGFKVNIFRYFGILTINNNIKVAKLKDKLNTIKMELYGVPMPKGFTPFTRSFRDISVATLSKFHAGITNSVPELEDRLLFPIPDITGKTKVYVARHMLSQGNPRYINYPGGTTMPLFPASLQEPGHTSLVLVEGIFDMLNLYDKGLVNVACCFGTNTIKHTLKEKLLPYLAQGVSKIYILFDGDAAGQKAAEELLPIIEEQNIAAEIITLEEGTDPGDMSETQVHEIVNYIKNG